MTEGVTNKLYAPVFHKGVPLMATKTEMVERAFGANPYRTSDIRNEQWKATEVQREYTTKRANIGELFNRLTVQHTGIDDPAWKSFNKKVEAYNQEVVKADPRYMLVPITRQWLVNEQSRNFKPTKVEKQF
jgi:hypothetical protein